MGKARAYNDRFACCANAKMNNGRGREGLQAPPVQPGHTMAAQRHTHAANRRKGERKEIKGGPMLNVLEEHLRVVAGRLTSGGAIVVPDGQVFQLGGLLVQAFAV